MALRYEGWDVRAAGTGMEAVRAAREFDPDAVVLDMMLPDFDGLEVLRRMRSTNPNVPVLFLTARDAVEDRVSGLTAGGDDYVTKPFSLEEVVARVRALMRRTTVAVSSADSVLVVDNQDSDRRAVESLEPGRGSLRALIHVSQSTGAVCVPTRGFLCDSCANPGPCPAGRYPCHSVPTGVGARLRNETIPSSARRAPWPRRALTPSSPASP
jgi:CheY-like chemotaxis protein